jgi:hypothetical protein
MYEIKVSLFKVFTLIKYLFAKEFTVINDNDGHTIVRSESKCKENIDIHNLMGSSR